MNNYVSMIFSSNKLKSNAIAIVDNDGKRETSLKELYDASTRIAAYISEKNIKGVVPICMPRCTETVEVILGIALAGLGVAPLSYNTPNYRVKLIEKQSGNEAFTFAQYEEAMKMPAREFTPIEFEGESPAYVVYTSGSTGMPKGVMLSSETVGKSILRMASPEFLDLDEKSVVLQMSAFSFVAIMIDLLAPLYYGCVTHILPEEARTDIELMSEYINKHGVTSMFITPKPLAQLENSPSLRVVCVGGERVSEMGPKNNYKLINVWGMSETAALALGYTITEPMDNTPIGKSLGDFRCYIIDDDGNLADEGELCLSGAIASGYYKRPDITAELFEPNPFCDEDGHKTLMHTGDIVRRLEDGNILYINRKDFMIKINGQRVEPGEAESVIMHIPGIKNAAVKGFTEEDGHTYLCAYYVCDSCVSEQFIKERLEEHLPEYMIPAFYVQMDELPLNQNGKLDRQALEAPKLNKLTAEYIAPTNELEQDICDAFEQVLKIDKVGIEDDFLHLGGDSIRAMTIAGILDVDGINSAAILTGRTPRGIAIIAEKAAQNKTIDAITEHPDKAPLTDNQMGIYFECISSPDSVKYNIPFAISFDRTENITCEKVAECVDKCIELHPAMYSRIEMQGEDVYMIRCKMPLEGICWAKEVREDAFDDEWKDFIRPFDLEKSPLVRVKALLSDTKVHIIFDAHHLISDGTSTAILVNQIFEALAGKEIKAEKIDAFELYNLLETDKETNLAVANEYFDNLLEDISSSKVSFADYDNDEENPISARRIINIEGLDFSKLHQLGITESTLFMGVYGYALSRMTGSDESIFGVAESGRNRADYNKTVSMMVRTLPLVYRASENELSYDILGRIQEQFYKSLDNDAVSFADLCAEHGIGGDVMFVYQSDLLSGIDNELGHVDIEIHPTGSTISEFNLAIFREGNKYKAVVDYAKNSFEPSTIDTFAEIFEKAARAFAENRALSEISASMPALSMAKRKQLARDYYDCMLEGFDKDFLILPDKRESNEPASGILKDSLGEELVGQIEEFCNNKNVDKRDIFTSAFGYILASYAGMEYSVFSEYGSENELAVVLCNYEDKEDSLEFISDIHWQLNYSSEHSVLSADEFSEEFGVSGDVVLVLNEENNDVDKAALALHVICEGNETSLELMYDPTKYTAELMEAFLSAFEMVLKGLVAGEKLNQIKFLSAKAEAKLDEYNCTDKPYDTSQTITDFFLDSVEKYPDKLCVEYKENSYTFKDVGILTAKIAGYLCENGIGNGDIVPILIHRNEYMVIAAHGAVRSGAAYLGLDASYPSERLEFMIKDSEAPLIIADRDLIGLVPGYKGKVLYTDEIAGLAELSKEKYAEYRKDPRHQITPENDAIIIYSSGTTGLPKGSILQHKAIVCFSHTYTSMHEMDETANVATYASFGFDGGAMDVFCAPMMGSSLFIIPDEIRLDLSALENFYIEHSITAGFMTTQVGCMFIGSTKCKTLKNFMVGGEKLIPALAPEWVTFRNGYGPSETMCYVNSYIVKDKDKLQPIGRTNDNIKEYVIDKHGRRVPFGASGELCISGGQLGRGYKNRPEKTAEAFVDNPYSNEDGYLRMYKTGDVVRILPDGNYDFVGRRDGQVKIRGFRVELSEVELQIRKYQGIDNVVVRALDNQSGGKYLVAYVVSEDELDVDDLKQFIASEKPDYMVPSAIIRMDEIPLTANGKVDMKKLPKPELKLDSTTELTNDNQKKIFEKIVSLTGASSLGINDDIFTAGLSSIDSIRLCAFLSEEFSAKVQIRDLKKNPTVAKLEALVCPNTDEKPMASDTEEVSAPVAEPAKAFAEEYPLSKTMEGIFAECIGNPDSTFYNVPYLMKIDSSIDEKRLIAAIVSAVEAHPYMKAEIFTDSNGRVCQHRRSGDDFTADMINIIEGNSIEEIIPTLVKPFMLLGGRLFEIDLIHADGTYLFLDFHHIIADGTSINIFIKDIEKAYENNSLKQEEYSGFDVAQNELEYRTEEELESAKDYYSNLLDDLDKSFLPLPDKYLHMEPASGRFVCDFEHVLLEDVKLYCEKNHVSLNAFFLSVFGYVLGSYAGMDYSVFNTVYNGRGDYRTVNTFAMLVKTLPVVCRLDITESKELVATIAKQLVDSMANDIYSYSEIAREFDVNNDVMCIFQGDGFELKSFCGAPVKEISLDLSDSKAAMALQIMCIDGRLVFDLEYDPNRFTEGLMKAFLSAFEMATNGFIAGKRLDEMSLLSPAMEAKLDEFNATEKPYDISRTVTDLFLESVEKYPDKLCVSYKNNNYTYSEVGVLTGKLAGYLCENGIGLGDIVPILINRNEYMVIAAQGVVRSGAAYLGLDPTYPSDRLEFMIKDSEAAVIIADRELVELVRGYEGRIIYTDEIAGLPELSKEKEAEYRKNPKHQITPDNDAIIIYSSGTTGLPKGSILQHRSILCFYHKYTAMHEIDANANVATYASFGFDGGAQDVFSVPMMGASLYVIPDEIRLDLSALENFYIRHSITSGFMTTQVGCMFIGQTKCKTLKNFMVGGEKIIPVVAPEWINFRNGYGPSETMCYVNSYLVKDNDKLQPIGRTNDNIKEYVIDKQGRRVPIGASGELCISGRQMGRGYKNRPEKTAEAFVDNPFSNEDGYQRMYKTGDVVRILPDGNYDFVGRRDGQVKIRGFRVELSEVELQIRKYEGIDNVVVTAPDSPSGGKYLAAYIVSEKDIDIDDLKKFIASEKPDYMVPSAIMKIDEIPLTSNGKVDKKKLPAIDQSTMRKGAEPVDETEEKICNIFEEVLGLDKVYADDDFFMIGGSSILAIQVLVKCEKAGMPIVYKDLFANPTAQKLSANFCQTKVQDVKASDLEKADGYNYSALEYNVEKNLGNIKNGPIGDVLLTGATGFLGSHVFYELLEGTSSKVVCLVRSKDGLPAELRLETMMIYYFEEWYQDELKSRVTVIDGDLEDDDLVDKLKDVHFDTIINCAANVKHFAVGDELLNANYSGVENLIEVAKEKNAKLIQISSLSVCGESVNGSVPSGYVFRETDLNIGQSLENKYVYSKYLAEQAVIDAISNNQITGKIIRLGNLMARFDDSEFQINAGSNGFIRLFIGFNKLGCFPVSMMDLEIEFSPIDAVSKSILLLSGTPDDFTVFHSKNCNSIHYGYLIAAMNENGRQIEVVEDEVFDERLAKALENSKNVELLGGLLAYKNSADSSLKDTLKFSGDGDEDKEIRVKIGSDTSFTTKALYRLSFAWPLVSAEYLDRMVKKLLELNFF